MSNVFHIISIVGAIMFVICMYQLCKTCDEGEGIGK